MLLLIALLSGCDRSRPHRNSRSVQEWFVAVRDSLPAGDTSAAAALSTLAAEHPESMRALIDGLGDRSVTVRLTAAHALLALGHAAVTAVDALANAALHDSDERVRAAAALALGSASSEHAWGVSALLGALRDSAVTVRAAAATGLGRVGGRARYALPELLSIARTDPNAAVRVAAAGAIERLRRSQ